MSKTRFKNTGKLKKDFIKKEKYKNKVQDFRKMPIGIKLPLATKKNSNESLFEMTYDINEQIKVNFKNLILTKKGEYLCNPGFGTNLIEIYNATNLENIEEVAMAEIESAVSTFMPFIKLKNYTSTKINETSNNPEYYKLVVDYTVEGLENKNSLIIRLLTSR